MDLNHWLYAYQAYTLTNWVIGPIKKILIEGGRIWTYDELTIDLQSTALPLGNNLFKNKKKLNKFLDNK